MKSNQIGIAAAVIAALFIGIAGFNAQTQKFGVVDLGKVAEESKLGKKRRTEFDAKRKRVGELLTFINDKRVMSRDQASKLAELMLADNPTPAQQTELTTLQTAITGQKAEFDNLLKVSQPTSDQLRRLNELSAMAQEALELAKDMQQDFGQQMNQIVQMTQLEVLDKVREATKKHGKKDGFAVIFESNNAPYGANDVSEDVLKVMDADNP
jgi:Skp family chaperone for outer membrane proteins